MGYLSGYCCASALNSVWRAETLPIPSPTLRIHVNHGQARRQDRSADHHVGFHLVEEGLDPGGKISPTLQFVAASAC